MKTTDQDRVAVAAHCDGEAGYLALKLRDGTQISIPVNMLEGLKGDDDTDALAEVKITREGLGLHWPKLDIELSVSELLAKVFGAQEEATRAVKQVVKNKKKFQKCLGVRTTTDIFFKNIVDKWKNNRVVKGFRDRLLGEFLKKSPEFNNKFDLASKFGWPLMVTPQGRVVVLALTIASTAGAAFVKIRNARELDFIGVDLCSTIMPISLIIAAIDGSITDEERATIENCFVKKWGYNSVYIAQYMDTLEQRPNEYSVENPNESLVKKLIDDLCDCIEGNEGINSKRIQKSVIDILDRVALVVQHKQDEKKQQISFIDQMLTEKLESDSNTENQTNGE